MASKDRASGDLRIAPIKVLTSNSVKLDQELTKLFSRRSIWSATFLAYIADNAGVFAICFETLLSVSAWINVVFGVLSAPNSSGLTVLMEGPANISINSI